MTKRKDAPKVKKAKTKKINLNGAKLGSQRKNLILITLSTLAVVVLSSIVFFALSAAYSTETYFVLNTNIQAKTEITPEIVVAQETSKGTAPRNALTMEEIQAGGVYARYPLYAGDVIASSNSGPANDTSLGIPDDWSVTSFTVASENAVGGTLVRGDYIDILGVDEEGARYVFNNVLILDSKFTSSEIEGEGDQVTVGEVIHYTVGMPAEDVGIFHSALNDYENIKVIQAPANVKYNGRGSLDSLDRPFKFGPGVSNKDLLLGSDPTFSKVLRDDEGIPVNEKNCKSGDANAELCLENNFEVKGNKVDEIPTKDLDDKTEDTVEETEDKVEE